MNDVQFDGALGVILGLMEEAKKHLTEAIQHKDDVREAMDCIYRMQYKLAAILLKTTGLTITE